MRAAPVEGWSLALRGSREHYWSQTDKGFKALCSYQLEKLPGELDEVTRQKLACKRCVAHLHGLRFWREHDAAAKARA